MLDPTVKLVTFAHGQGGGHHQQGTRTLTPDGQRLVDWARSLPDEQNAAVIKAFSNMGLNWTDTGMDAERYGRLNPNNPARYDRHTGRYYVHGEDDSDPGTVICTDQSLLVAKRHR